MMVQIKEAGTGKGWNIDGNQIGRWLRRRRKKRIQTTDVVYIDFPKWGLRDDAWNLAYLKICIHPDLYYALLFFPPYNGCNSQTPIRLSCVLSRKLQV